MLPNQWKVFGVVNQKKNLQIRLTDNVVYAIKSRDELGRQTRIGDKNLKDAYLVFIILQISS